MSTDTNRDKEAHSAITAMSNSADTRAAKWQHSFSTWLQGRLRPMQLNRAKFAALLGVGVQTVSGWLNETAAPSRGRAILIASKFNQKTEMRARWLSIFGRPKCKDTKPIPRGCRVLTLSAMAARYTPRSIAKRYAMG